MTKTEVKDVKRIEILKGDVCFVVVSSCGVAVKTDPDAANVFTKPLPPSLLMKAEFKFEAS